MKVLENYVHAWLGPRMAGLQREPAVLFDYVDRVIGSSEACVSSCSRSQERENVIVPALR